MSDTLKPCWSCEGTNIDWEFSRDGQGNMNSGCMDCGACGPAAKTKEESIRLWNTRPIEAALSARIAELEAAAREVLNELWETNDEFTEYQQALWEKVPLS